MRRSANAANAANGPSVTETAFRSLAARSQFEPRDRFIGFAFAAADLLVEMEPDRRVRFATGAFFERLGRGADTFLGQNVAALIDAEDHGGLDVALSLLVARGRLMPIAVRLANPSRTCVALSGLCLPENQGVSWLTFARMPSAGAAPPALAAAPVLRRALDERLREQQGVDVSFIEVAGWSRLEEGRKRELENSIGTAMRSAGGQNAMAADLSDGRFGLLSQHGMDLAELEQRVAQILRGAGGVDACGVNAVGGTLVAVPAGAASAAEAIRAMRFALGCFVKSGRSGLAEAGFGQGLRGFLDQTEGRTLAMRAAIEQSRFKLAFQPVVTLADRRVVHYEALLRPHAVPGLPASSTEQFVAFAEAMGLIEALDNAVLAQASRKLRESKARIAINVSGVTIQTARFRETLLGLIEAERGLSERLIVELTETTDIDDMQQASETVRLLGQAGIAVCLDDFGAGFASFRYLLDFRVSYVKIDGSYVRQMTNGARECGIIGAMAELARSVGAGTVAESIETEAQSAACLEQGVMLGQGWLFGKPGALPGSR